jgi:hypothetical protein
MLTTIMIMMNVNEGLSSEGSERREGEGKATEGCVHI